MRYLEINSRFINNEFNNMLYPTLDQITNYVRRNSDKGNLDCAMSKFGQSFDSFVNDYFIDHLKFCRKYQHFDENNIKILRVLNVYKKVGVHEMFKKLYPKNFEVKKQPIRKNIQFSSGDSATLLERLGKHLKSDDIVGNVSALLQQFNCRNTKEFIEMLNLRDYINASSAFRSIYSSLIKNNRILRDIIENGLNVDNIHYSLNDVINSIDDNDFDEVPQPKQAVEPPIYKAKINPATGIKLQVNGSFGAGISSSSTGTTIQYKTPNFK